MPLRTQFQTHWNELRTGLLDLLYPRQDLWSGEPMRNPAMRGKYISEQSAGYLRFIHAPFCESCGFPLYGLTDGSEACQQCRHWERPGFASNRSILLLNRLGRRIVHELKYHQGLYLLDDLALLIRTHASPELKSRVTGHQLVPVPLHPIRLRERGYNQSHVLAKLFAETLGDGTTRVCEALIRTRPTPSQTLMDRRARMRNVASAFAPNPSIALNLHLPVTLVDDVFTTGSTMHACATTLRKAGVGAVQSLTLGHG